MTSRYSDLYAAISAKYSNHQQPDLVKAPTGFPFPQIYRSQSELLSGINPSASFCLTSHTGWGKTPVFLHLVRGKPALVIEPRKFLQSQVASYYGDYVLFGRAEYDCPFAPAWNARKTAAMAPCLTKADCSTTSYHETCANANSTCLNEPCDVFADANNKYHRYPCPDCEYLKAMAGARAHIRDNGCVICNFGNFWQFVKPAKAIVIDEADLFFKEISAPVKLRYTTPKKNADENLEKMLGAEVEGIRTAMKDAPASQRYKYQNALYSAQFLQKYHDLCFMYQRKDAYFIEVDPRNTNILAEKIFKDKQVIVVSATPGKFNYPNYAGSIHQRSGIYFLSIGSLTTTALKANPYLLSNAAKAISEISDYMDMVYDADRVIIHCGNLGTHAAAMNTLLGPENCILHESGRLNQTIERYLASDKRYLLVAAAEYGMDASWCKLQFILKFPYAKKDERINTLMRVMGPDFREYYEGEARTRVIQMAGRNVRGFDDFGVTICLDAKCREDYMRHKGMYPEWYRERVVERWY